MNGNIPANKENSAIAKKANNLDNSSNNKSSAPRTGGGGRMSEYKKQLLEKQKLKKTYGVSEEQFRRFFKKALTFKNEPTGDILLRLLELRADNVVYRLKMALSRKHARQMIVHGHFKLNGKKIKTPSIILSQGDVIELAEGSKSKSSFLDTAVDKRLNIGIKVPEWLDLAKENYKGSILRLPERVDISTRSETHLIVELYSK